LATFFLAKQEESTPASKAETQANYEPNANHSKTIHSRASSAENPPNSYGQPEK
jgi:hypothetical protein